MTEAQIKHMVNRFLSWRLPEDFSPDAGISFKPTFNEFAASGRAYPMKHEPVGTNLFDATQAEAMVRYMLEPSAAPSAGAGRTDETGWVIERGDSEPGAPTYWTGFREGAGGVQCWSQNHMDAIRFARKIDAERVSYRMAQPNNRVCEHKWLDPEAW